MCFRCVGITIHQRLYLRRAQIYDLFVLWLRCWKALQIDCTTRLCTCNMQIQARKEFLPTGQASTQAKSHSSNCSSINWLGKSQMFDATVRLRKWGSEDLSLRTRDILQYSAKRAVAWFSFPDSVTATKLRQKDAVHRAVSEDRI